MESESESRLTLTWSTTESATDTWLLDEELTTKDRNEKDDREVRGSGGSGKRATPCNHSQELYLLEQLPIEVLTHAYVTPVLILFTVLTNSMVCVVLLKKEIRTATNCILVAMAISDMLTGVFPLPCFLYFYTAGHYRDYVPQGWCFTYYCLTDYLPTVTHTASIWLTVALASQRFICVRHSFKAKNVCTVSNIMKIICAIYIFAFLSHCNRFFELQFDPVEVRSLVDPQSTVMTCHSEFSPFVKTHEQLYFNVYYWYRVVFIHLVPCLTLVVLNSILVWTILEAELRRSILQNRSECRRLMESNATTLMLVVVVGVLVLVELPLAVLFVIMILENTLSMVIIAERTTKLLTLVVNLLILLSYPLNFFIYCGMSSQFRKTFQGLFRRGRRGRAHQRFRCSALQGRSAVSENGSFDITSGCHGNNSRCDKTKGTSFFKTTTI